MRHLVRGRPVRVELSDRVRLGERAHTLPRRVVVTGEDRGARADDRRGARRHPRARGGAHLGWSGVAGRELGEDLFSSIVASTCRALQGELRR